jgi:hypothetical protein
LLLMGYVMGFAWTPGGNAPSRVLDGNGCPVSEPGGDVSVEGPHDRPAEDNQDYKPGHQWSLLAHDPEKVLRVGFGGHGAEHLVKAQLPWKVRWRMEWDSESGLFAVYGSHADVCMVARVVAHRARG